MLSTFLLCMSVFGISDETTGNEKMDEKTKTGWWQNGEKYWCKVNK